MITSDLLFLIAFAADNRDQVNNFMRPPWPLAEKTVVHPASERFIILIITAPLFMTLMVTIFKRCAINLNNVGLFRLKLFDLYPHRARTIE